MKKNFTKMALAAMAMLMCFGGEADAQKKLCLRQIDAQEEGDYTYYGYDQQGRLDSLYMYVCFYDEELYRLYEYDENGNIVNESGHCILPENNNEYKKFTKTFDVIYEYDENNKLIKRANYNLDTWGGTGEYLLGGVYKYYYDEQGKLIQRKLFWDKDCMDLFEEADYNYDENGVLMKEVYKMADFSGNLSEETIVSYEYDEKGHMIHIRTDVRNHETNEIEEYDNIIYKYDDNGNLTNRINYAKNPDLPTEEHILVYNTDMLASDVAMPINLEDDMDFFVRSTNVVVRDSIYRRDVEGDLFDLFDVQDWTYGELDNTSGIENVSNNSEIIAISRDNEGNLILNGVARNENVRIYDANGKLISNGVYNGKVNVGALPRGMYVVSTRKGCVKICR